MMVSPCLFPVPIPALPCWHDGSPLLTSLSCHFPRPHIPLHPLAPWRMGRHILPHRFLYTTPPSLPPRHLHSAHPCIHTPSYLPLHILHHLPLPPPPLLHLHTFNLPLDLHLSPLPIAPSSLLPWSVPRPPHSLVPRHRHPPLRRPPRHRTRKSP